MSSIPIQFVRHGTKEILEATLHLDLHPNQLIETEKEWDTIRRASTRL